MRESKRGKSGKSESRSSGRSKKSTSAPDITRHRVHKIFAENPKKVFTYKSLSRRLGVNSKEGREQVFEYLKQLRNEGDIILLENDKYVYNFTMREVEGIVDLANSKYAYIVSEDSEEDIRVFTDKLMFAMDGDRVRVRMKPPRKKGDRPEGEVVQIIERIREDIVGRVELSKNFAFVVPDY
ncbi:MAG: ribonuclease R, partial [Hymenobacteraceae bacterium]|nr:ribonuclease R [Hymenobacteraceae bacterium]MDX5395331.1 ribonuclease R [Hymenobacteraceae bacterium]MDX5511381.1 ribonuclease R [Hymenobacteraceae bacterium]